MTAGLLVAGLVVVLGIVVRSSGRHTASAAVRQRVLLRPELTHRRAVPRRFVEMLDQAGVADAAAWWRTALIGVPAGLGLVTLSFGPGAVALVVPALAVAPFLVSRWAAARAVRQRESALPNMLEDVALALRAGSSLRQALASTAARAEGVLAGELAAVVSAVERGGTLVTELEAWCARRPSDGLSLTVTALALGVETGGHQARALDGVAATLRDRLAVSRELAALSSSARASAVVMVVAPVVFAGFASAADQRTAHFLFGSAGGLACLGGGLVLDGVAAVWMLRLTGAPQ